MPRFICVEFRECQKKDWKNGAPRPHKLVCGKSFKEDPSFSGNSTLADSKPKINKVPLPDPSFRRSPALCYQILKLEKDDNPDYVVSCRINKSLHVLIARFSQLVPPDQSPDIGIHIPGWDPEMLFCFLKIYRLTNMLDVIKRCTFLVLRQRGTL